MLVVVAAVAAVAAAAVVAAVAGIGCRLSSLFVALLFFAVVVLLVLAYVVESILCVVCCHQVLGDTVLSSGLHAWDIIIGAASDDVSVSAPPALRISLTTKFASQWLCWSVTSGPLSVFF